MIYIDNQTFAQAVKIPRFKQTSGTSYSLKMRRHGVEGTYSTIPTTYQSQDTMFVTLNVTLPSGMESGEYLYLLMEADTYVSGGIISISGVRYADKENDGTENYKEYGE